MKSQTPKSIIGKSGISSFVLCFCVFSFALSDSFAVSSKVTTHTTGADFSAGETNDVVVSSRGFIQLGRAAELLVEEFEDVWSINSIVANAGTIYLGTSPNGGVYKYSVGKLTKIYPIESDKKTAPAVDSNDPNKSKGQSDSAERYMTNEHIFAMATDVSGRLLVGISGKQCKLLRFKSGKMKTIYEPNDAKYIFAIAVADNGDIYLGTGPTGKIYKLDSFAKKSELIYDSLDKNVLSLAVGADGFIYAGTDSRGLVYKINPRTKKATVLYDSSQKEITALLFSSQDNNLYAAATSAKVVQAQAKFARQLSLSGRPESPSSSKQNSGGKNGGLSLKIANTKKKTKAKDGTAPTSIPKPPMPSRASCIYKITDDGFVTEVFKLAAVFFCMTEQKNHLLLGTGNKAELYSIDQAEEEDKIIYTDEQASQITAMAVLGGEVYLGTANPAKLLKMTDKFAQKGSFSSRLIDAGRPAKWGKLQIEADIPKTCEVFAACRSGNVKDINDPTFSDWTDPVEVTAPVQLQCPAARFCQYKLVLQTPDGKSTPVVREVAVAAAVPNLAPKVKLVKVNRLETAGKKGVFKVGYKATDRNNDKLIYKIEFRKIGRENWIELEDELKESSFEWDGKTVEDGRYELKVTASDIRSNTTTTALTASRISDPVVVDNTPPTIKKHSIKKDGKTITLKLQLLDRLSAIGKVYYTIDSNKDWISTIPEDLVYDTTEEDFTIVVENLQPGEHIISIKANDDVGNTTYKTFEVNE